MSANGNLFQLLATLSLMEEEEEAFSVSSERKDEVSTEKKDEVLMEKKEEVSTEKKEEVSAEKKDEVLMEKKEEVSTEKKEVVVVEDSGREVIFILYHPCTIFLHFNGCVAVSMYLIWN